MSDDRKKGSRIDELAAEELERLRERVEEQGANRWNADPEDVQRALVKLVLTLIEFLRRLLERQAIRRMEKGSSSRRLSRSSRSASGSTPRTWCSTWVRWGSSIDGDARVSMTADPWERSAC